MSSFDPADIDEALQGRLGSDWADQRARLREALDVLNERMHDSECTAAELAAVARERRLTLQELVLLGDEEVELSALDEIQARREKRMKK
jgi:hypothetical protein